MSVPQAEFGLAKCLAASGRDHARMIALAKSALNKYRRLGFAEQEVLDIQAFLRRE